MRVLVVGGYGLIGLEIVRRLSSEGHSVTGLGRSAAQGRRAAPQIAWIGADIAKLSTPAAWLPHLHDIDAVVNSSGALQDGARDDLVATQEHAIQALIAACAQSGATRFVQISAPGAEANATTAFLRTKAAADATLRASALDWIIFRPGLVISANAYGGTSLLRMLAAFPIVQPLVLGDRRLQTVAISDVADAVDRALAADAPLNRAFDLVEDEAHSLSDIVSRFRAWLGFDAAACTLLAPLWLGVMVARVGDLAGWLGWRSPLRSTSLRVLDQDVICDPAPWKAIVGAPLKSLDTTLYALPATAQERTYARAALIFPLLVVTLATFWLASGAIGLAHADAAAQVMKNTQIAPVAKTFVIGFALLDIAIGIALLVRSATCTAALAAIAISLFYLIFATSLAPHLWLDPLGPLVKVFPTAALALTVAALARDR